MCDGLQDGAERLEADGDVKEMGGEEEVIEVSEHGEAKVPGDVQERLHNSNCNNHNNKR